MAEPTPPMTTPGTAAPSAPPATILPQRRWAVISIAVISVALIAMPAVFGMFTRAPKGATMIGQFKPFMTSARLNGYQHELKEINAGVRQADTEVASQLDGIGGQAAFDANYPTFATFDQQWPQIDSVMTSLMNEVQGNQGNYEAVAALPSFKLFPYFFVIPGVLLAGIALSVLLRATSWRRRRWVLVALGVGLIAAPAIFQMFNRAPKGGRMMTAFTHIETTQNVQQIQGFFGSMAEGQGAIRLEIVPALTAAGYSPTQIKTTFPAVATLDAQWVHILNDMTPMIGTMSDNVANYQAIKSLPPFPLFPWFFVFPGLIVAGLGVAAGRQARSRQPVPATVAATAPPQPTYQGVS